MFQAGFQPSKFAKRLCLELDVRGLSQREGAALCGVPLSNFHRVCRGQAPKLDTYLRICDRLLSAGTISPSAELGGCIDGQASPPAPSPFPKRPRSIVWHTVKCEVCGIERRLTGKEFSASAKRTCGAPFCLAQLHARAARTVRQAEVLVSEARREAHARSEKTGRGEGHRAARRWSLRDPAGRVHRFANLSNWLRENGTLFEAEDVVERPQKRSGFWCRANVQLRRLRPEGKALKRSWKGWTWAFDPAGWADEGFPTADVKVEQIDAAGPAQSECEAIPPSSGAGTVAQDPWWDPVTRRRSRKVDRNVANLQPQARVQASPGLFSEEPEAIAFIEAVIWPHGTVCPHCGYVGEAIRLAANPARGIRHGLSKCRSCSRQFTVRGATPFADTKIPLRQGLHALYLVSCWEGTLSARKLADATALSWPTAQKLKRVLTESSGSTSHDKLAAALSTL